MPASGPRRARIPVILAAAATLLLPACAPQGAESPDQELRGPGTGLEDQTAPPNPGELDTTTLDTPPPGQVEVPTAPAG